LVKSVEEVVEQLDQERAVSRGIPAVTTTKLPSTTLAWG
jgi:hypothetical protein